MKHFMLIVFCCSALPVILGGCSGCTKTENSLSFRERILKAEKQKDPNIRAWQLLRIADDQIQARDLSGATKTLRSAGQACREISEPVTQASKYALLIEADARLDDKMAARKDFEEGWKAVEAIGDKDAKARAMARLGQAQGAVKDDAQQAGQTVRQAEKLASELPDPLARGLALIAVAEAFGKIGDTAEADRVIGQILAMNVPEGRNHVQLLARTALVQYVLKEAEAAQKTFSLAIETADNLENPHRRANALADVAEELARAGNAKHARQLLDQAEKVAAKIPELDLQQQTLFRVHTLMEKMPR